ncbi:hypothetical protein P3L10_010848 [Capsicum annuum]
MKLRISFPANLHSLEPRQSILLTVCKLGIRLMEKSNYEDKLQETPENILLKCSYPGGWDCLSQGNIIRVTENAQKLEEKRLTVYNEIAAQNEALGLGSNKAYRKFEMEIARRIKTITGSKETVRVKAVELIKLISDSTCPQSISIAMFAQKVVSLCVNPTGSFNSAVYAYGRVIVQVTSKVRRLLNESMNANVMTGGPKSLGMTSLHLSAKGGHV